ncbi:LacI family DNA-binding transcriptional regulator [Winogradskyella echinorum]|uniref:LacI family DNA-binding transcriptional regulator n=1 Tax=Winogradskyella echinorum TaxID=538189 RepID=A0ABR6Y3T4_9FLAO|nr:LacI family DNA-binding transcriptional regulator [Winogradskyella echinorum]MBC3847407.1 LacI family DNA-binding transcriptional regulator [Winogradskyella echinorum]MBC5751755.1 LacI family DNA-binding transcriptional regulator [Winogradskyella echinorum]
MTTLKELAALLNISVSTVSKALNDSHEISENTRVRVKELATKLNYKPNRIAQQLKTNKTKTIGVILPTVTNPFFAEVLHGIEMAAANNDYDIIVCLSNETLHKEKRSLELLSNGSVDGFIMAVAREGQVKMQTEHIQTVIDRKIPVLMFDRVVNEINCDKVIVDDFQSVYEATEYLIKKEKRKNILLVSNIEELSVGKLRIEGYSKALKEHNLNPNILKLDNAIDLDIETKTYNYLKKHKHIDAVISIDHVTGIVAINMAKKIGKKIPEELSVLGFGYEHTQLLSSPKISIIHQKAHKIGEMSIELLIDNMKNNEHKLQTIVVPSEVKLSESTK